MLLERLQSLWSGLPVPPHPKKNCKLQQQRPPVLSAKRQRHLTKDQLLPSVSKQISRTYKPELGSVNEALAAKRQRLSELAETITSKAHPSYQQLERQVTSLEGEAAKLTAQIGKTQASLDGQTKSTQATTAATKEAAVEIITYAEAIRQVQANIAAYVEEQALFADFGDFWRVASGQVEGYSTAIDLATASVVNHQTELETLLNAGFFDGLDDPIKDYVAALQATSESADAALGPINEVGEAVGNADFRAAEADLNNYDEALTLTRRSHILVGSAIRQETTPAVEDLTTAT